MYLSRYIVQKIGTSENPDPFFKKVVPDENPKTRFSDMKKNSKSLNHLISQSLADDMFTSQPFCH